MARRRMFSLDVVDTDAFLDLPLSSQALYFHLGMRADDDGFVTSPKRIAAVVSASPDDLKLLAVKGFIIPFDSGVCVIRDWRKNNYLRPDRYTPTTFSDEKALLIESDSHCYQLLDTAGLPTVDQRYPQVRLGKEREDQGSIGEESSSKDSGGEFEGPGPQQLYAAWLEHIEAGNMQGAFTISNELYKLGYNVDIQTRKLSKRAVLSDIER